MKRDILIVCDSHIFAVKDALERSAFADRIAYVPVLFYADTMAAIAGGQPLLRDPQAAYGIAEDKFRQRVEAGELVEGVLPVSNYAQIIFIGHFLFERILSRTFVPNTCFFPGIRPGPEGDTDPMPQFVSAAVLRRAMLPMLEWPAVRAIQGLLAQGARSLLVVPGPPVAHSVLQRVLGAAYASCFDDVSEVFRMHRALVAEAIGTPDRVQVTAAEQELALTDRGFLKAEYMRAEGDIHANAHYGRWLLSNVLAPQLGRAG